MKNLKIGQSLIIASPLIKMKKASEMPGDNRKAKQRVEKDLDKSHKGGLHWFEKMNKQDQVEYIKLHPKSKYAKKQIQDPDEQRMDALDMLSEKKRRGE